MNKILAVSQLTKTFGNFAAVNDISFSLKKGEILGLLGPNGAGKTTTIHMLLGITSFTSGKIEYFGQDFLTHRTQSLQRINFASSFNGLQGKTQVVENLLFYSRLYNVKNAEKRIDELLEYFEVSELKKTKYWDLSAGQRTRVNLIKALLNEPEIILMDEPTASLDPDISDKLLSLIERLRRDQKLSIVYTSHDMSEVSRICDRVVFMDHGVIVAEDTPLGLIKRIKTATVQLSFDAKKSEVANVLKKAKFEHEFLSDIVVRISTKEENIPQVIYTMSNENIWITDIEVKKPTLEDFFLQIARKRKR